LTYEEGWGGLSPASFVLNEYHEGANHEQKSFQKDLDDGDRGDQSPLKKLVYVSHSFSHPIKNGLEDMQRL